MEQQKPLEILVIYDDRGVSDLLSELIVEAGANTTTAQDGKEGIEKFMRMHKAGTPYDVVFTYDERYTDGNMSIPAGPHVTKEVKSSRPSTLVYILTKSLTQDPSKQLETYRHEMIESAPDGVIDLYDAQKQIKGIIEQLRSYQLNPMGKFTYKATTAPQS
ncbi:MAG: hypothetical protein AABX34_07160 [Nanoarchaeota archaeon]